MSIFKSLFAKKPEPFTVDTELGRFTMEYYDKEKTKPAYAYLGFVNGLEDENPDGIESELYCDNESTFDMNYSLAILKDITDNKDEWFSKAKCAIAEYRKEDDGTIEVYDNLGKAVYISPEEFINGMSVIFIRIYDDGNIQFEVSARYKGENPFGDHCTYATIARDGSVVECGFL